MDTRYLSILKGKDRPLPKTHKGVLLHRLFERNAVQNSNNTALIFEHHEDGHLSILNETYSELNKISNKLSHSILKFLQQNNISNTNNDGDNIIAISMSPSIELIQILLALWKCGACYLPLDITAPEQRIKHILNESKPLLIITENNNGIDNPAYRGFPVLSFSKLKSHSSVMSDENIRDDEMMLYQMNNNVNSPNIAIVLYTSGSTGVPKGVRLPHEVILNRLIWQWNEYPYSHTECVCAFKTALTFVDAVSEIWGPLLHEMGNAVLIIPREVTKNPDQLIHVLNKYKVERLVLVPSLLRSMLMFLNMAEQDPEDSQILLKHLKLWVCSGEPLAKSLCIDFFNHFEKLPGVPQHVLCNFYGSTEVMGDVTFYEMRNLQDVHSFEKIPIGKSIDNTHIYLLDTQNKPVALGDIGEIYACGLNIAAGYVNGRDPDKFIHNEFTSEHEYEKMYKTGDYGRIVNNILLYEGRTDSQVKIRGNRVDLSEIEAALNKINYVDKTSVLCYKPGEVDQALLAFITLQPEVTQVTNADVEKKLSEFLNPYSIPQVIIKNSIPLLINGKIDRQSLLRSYAEMAGKLGKFQIDYSGIPEKKHSIAKILFETISDILGASVRDHIGVNSNFYQIGGNSLNSIFTITKLRTFGYTISITDFISAPTLGERRATSKNNLDL